LEYLFQVVRDDVAFHTEQLTHSFLIQPKGFIIENYFGIHGQRVIACLYVIKCEYFFLLSLQKLRYAESKGISMAFQNCLSTTQAS